MDTGLAGQAVFERIRDDILSGPVHWVEREIGCSPFRWEPGRKRADDTEEDDWGEVGDCSASVPVVCNRGE